MTDAAEIRLNTSQGSIAGLAWRQPGSPRVLMLHGWLDNAASFLPLAPHLNGLDRVAIDLPGHGHSEHRHPSTRYHFIDYLFNVDAVLDALEWNDCHLVGHSMGAAVSACYAAGVPERVRSIVLLDTLGPISVRAKGTADRLRRSLFAFRKQAGEVRHFENIEAMVKARCSVSDLSPEAARLICERGSRRRNGGHEWRSDPALRWISAIVMTDEQALDLVGNIQAPVLSYLATLDARWSSEEKLKQRREAMRDGQHHVLEGLHHHFHMDVPERIAGAIRTFIMDNDQPWPGDSK